jgi:transposase
MMCPSRVFPRGLIVTGKRFCGDSLRRSHVAEFFRQQASCLIGIEATQGAHYWGRVLRAFGHEVRLIAPQFVKPYVKSQNNDANDAEAICEAVGRPNMRFVASKSIGQLDLQALQRIRSRIVGSRTQLGESDSWSARRVWYCASPSSQPGAQSAARAHRRG